MRKKLATFRIDDNLWQAFQAKAKINNTNASELLVSFVESYIQSEQSILENKSIDSIDNLGSIDSIDTELRQCIDGKINDRLKQITNNQNEINNQIYEYIDSKINEIIDYPKSQELGNKIKLLETRLVKLEYQQLTVDELKKIAISKNIEFDSKIKKSELIELLLE